MADQSDDIMRIGIAVNTQKDRLRLELNGHLVELSTPPFVMPESTSVN